ncbi:MAG TPA: LysM peptidoglycan-binding domain-containing protein [Gammaproteobacteria bacterium]|nr:LysM peptidoglycan-binding domain-containing protein [Gammaproteobacteria bacterium]
MRIASRCLTVAYAFVLFAFQADAQPELFPRPAALEPAVKFWTRIYTEVDTKSGFIHDDLRLDIVYQTVRWSDDVGARERRRRVERATESIRTILTKLASGARQNLSDDEQRVLKLFPEGTSNAEFRAAAGRLRFQLGQSDRFREGLVRSGAWKPYIHEVLAKNGLPLELAALPHVESSFDPTAYSKVGAAGLWQFMRSTGVRYMRIDHIVDERRDPFFATNAAARLLGDNFSVIQSWPLALTAYNHGLASMRRAVQQQKTTDIATIVAKYQSRSFGFASRNFYTAFLAALEIDSNPDRYFPNLKIDPPSDTATITVPAFMTVDTLADALNLRESTLRSLNPALTDTVWSGDKYVPQGFELRVPQNTAAVAEARLDAIEPGKLFAAQRADREHREQRGDTLSKIAAEYRVSLAALMRINGMTNRSVLRVGQTIMLPTDGAIAPPDATLVREEAPAPAPAAAAPALASTSAEGLYVVRRGDSIERIATRLGVDPQALVAANDIRNRNVIQVGQQLIVPTAPGAVIAVAAVTTTLPTVEPPVSAALDSPAAVAAEPVAAADLTAALAPAVLANGEPAPVSEADESADDEVNVLAVEQDVLAADPSDYTVSATNEISVQPLETLGHYADWLEIPTQRLRDLNSLSFREGVVLGQTLTLEFARIDAATFEQRRRAYHQQLQSDFFAAYQIEDVESHVMRSGESLWILAARTYNVPVWLLRQYNPDLNLDRIQAGVVVKFPRLKAIAADTAVASRPQVLADNER